MYPLPGCSLAAATPARSIAATSTPDPDPFLTMRLLLPLGIEPKRPSASGGLPEILADVLSALDFVLAADLVAHDDPVVLELVQREIVIDDDGDQFSRLCVFEGGLRRFRIGAGDLDLHGVAHQLHSLRHCDAGGEQDKQDCRSSYPRDQYRLGHHFFLPLFYDLS